MQSLAQFPLIPSRRISIRHFSLGFGAATLNVSGLPHAFAGAFENTEAAGAGLASSAQSKPLGIALVGLGSYSTGQLAPALQETKNCKLTGIVTGTPEKAENWKKKYNIPEKNIYNYENYASIKDNSDIDIVYVVLPNGMHAEYTIKAAQAGKHVICEKPMAISVKECKQMLEACQKANRLLSIGYRLHFEPHNQEMMRLGQEKIFGQIEKLDAKNAFKIEPNVWRLDKELAGGGPLMDLGIYCVQGAIYTTGEVPVTVTAKEGKKDDLKKFKEVEQSISWRMEFPGGAVAECECSYAESWDSLRAEAEDGFFELSPAYAYNGIEGETSKGKMDFPQVNQQALQMDDFAQCVLNNQKSKVPGEMGIRDVKILMAIYEAARTGKRVTLS